MSTVIPFRRRSGLPSLPITLGAHRCRGDWLCRDHHGVSKLAKQASSNRRPGFASPTLPLRVSVPVALDKGAREIAITVVCVARCRSADVTSAPS